MHQNPDFGTRSWPTVNTNGTKKSLKLSQQHFGGFGTRGVPDPRAAGNCENQLRFVDTKKNQAMT